METINQQLISFINQSPLITDEEKKLWQEAINGLPEKFCSDIFEFAKSEKNGLRIITDSLEEKIDLIKNQDMDGLEKILNKDKEYLESLKK
jgi:hemerythrin-like domain-containing protein